MTQPIYRLFLNRFTNAWYQLSKEEQDRFGAKHTKAFDKLGIKMINMCNAGWSTEQWDFFGVAEYPNIEAVYQLHQMQSEWGWFRYVESMSVLGTKLEA